jgi:hypothetical protein
MEIVKRQFHDAFTYTHLSWKQDSLFVLLVLPTKAMIIVFRFIKELIVA